MNNQKNGTEVTSAQVAEMMEQLKVLMAENARKDAIIANQQVKIEKAHPIVTEFYEANGKQLTMLCTAMASYKTVYKPAFQALLASLGHTKEHPIILWVDDEKQKKVGGHAGHYDCTTAIIAKTLADKGNEMMIAIRKDIEKIRKDIDNIYMSYIPE